VSRARRRARPRWQVAALAGVSTAVIAIGVPVGINFAAGHRQPPSVDAGNPTQVSRSTRPGSAGDSQPIDPSPSRPGGKSHQHPGHPADPGKSPRHRKEHHSARPHRPRRTPKASHSGKPTGGKPTHTPDPPGTATGLLVPSSGSYLGAYVQPTDYSSAGQVDAVEGFEHLIGSSIDLVHVYHPWTQPFPSGADQQFVGSGKVLLLTWGGTPDTKKIVAGDYDSLIKQRADAVKSLARPILMEFRHEMDRPNLQWAVHGPAAYIRAWDHIRSIFADEGATNVGWVWCPTGYGFQVGRAQAFYPGNREVDWVCADVYAFRPSQPLAQAAGPFMKFALATGKPILVGEFAVNGAPTAWAKWIAGAGRFAEQYPRIKGIAYFDANGTDSNGNPFKYWLGGHQSAVDAFARLAKEPYFKPAVPS
jgi:Glycosyl hydrolase family 26